MNELKYGRNPVHKNVSTWDRNPIHINVSKYIRKPLNDKCI